MKKTVRMLLVVLIVFCISALFATVNVSAAETDYYGLKVFGKAVTSDYKSNASEGWSFDSNTNTLTLTDGDKFNAAFEKLISKSDASLAAFYRYDPSCRHSAFAFYMTAVDVKTLTNLNVKVTGDVTLGKPDWCTGYYVPGGLSLVRTMGFYSRSGGITVTGGGKLTVYSTDTAFYTNGDFKTEGKEQKERETYRTATIYEQCKINK